MRVTGKCLIHFLYIKYTLSLHSQSLEDSFCTVMLYNIEDMKFIEK